MKLLYITANPKLEEQSACLTVGRRFIERCKVYNPELVVEEMHLYKENIPEVDFEVFTGRAEIKSGAAYDALPEDKKLKADRVNFLCEQFLSADRYVIAAPMWSLFFSGRLKNYLDCIIQNHKVIEINEQVVKGLLDDKVRRMVYIQSSGGKYASIVTSRLDYGTDYLHVLFKFLGVKEFLTLPVEGTGLNNTNIAGALMRAADETDHVVDMLLKQ